MELWTGRGLAGGDKLVLGSCRVKADRSFVFFIRPVCSCLLITLPVSLGIPGDQSILISSCSLGDVDMKWKFTDLYPSVRLLELNYLLICVYILGDRIREMMLIIS